MTEASKDSGTESPEYPPLDETGTVDLWQIEANLALTPAERIKRFEGFLELYHAMRRAGKKYYGERLAPGVTRASCPCELGGSPKANIV